jgi:hypothetical protein
MTSQALLAQITGQYIAELLGERECVGRMIATMPSLLPGPPLEPVVLDNSKKSILPVATYKTQVTVQKSDFYIG